MIYKGNNVKIKCLILALMIGISSGCTKSEMGAFALGTAVIGTAAILLDDDDHHRPPPKPAPKKPAPKPSKHHR